MRCSFPGCFASCGLNNLHLMRRYYLGGYYLIRQQPLTFGSSKSKIVFTCSTCINDGIIDTWSYSWTRRNNAEIETIKQAYRIKDKTVSEIRLWVDSAHDNNKIGWPNLFNDLETAKEFKTRFLSHLVDIKIFG